MKLTKVKALQETEKIWAKLAQNGENRKPVTEFTNDCPCCGYVSQHGNQFSSAPKACPKCPLKTLWPTHCENSGPYYLWLRAQSSFLKRKYATIIAKACRDALKKLRKKG